MHIENFGYYISMIHRHTQICFEREFKKFGFGSGQYMFFIHIAKNEGTTQKYLSEFLAIDKGTTAKAIKKLMHLEYVFAVQVDTDHRSSKLFLTEKGKEILPLVEEILNATSNKLKTEMNEIEETNTLISLQKMASNIKNL